jgi:hypothetical protein
VPRHATAWCRPQGGLHELNAVGRGMDRVVFGGEQLLIDAGSFFVRTQGLAENMRGFWGSADKSPGESGSRQPTPMVKGTFCDLHVAVAFGRALR